jgi:hypothetical protein
LKKPDAPIAHSKRIALKIADALEKSGAAAKSAAAEAAVAQVAPARKRGAGTRAKPQRAVARRK